MKKIAFIIYKYPLGVSSMLVNSIEMFARKGCKVIVYTTGKNLIDTGVNFIAPGIELISCPPPTSISVLLCKILRVLCRRLFIKKTFLSSRFFRKYLFFLKNTDDFYFISWLKKQLFGKNFDCIIPIEIHSLIITDLAGKEYLDRTIYYNLELLPWKVPASSPYYSLLYLKKFEANIIKDIKKVILTSPLRAKIFSKETPFPIEKTGVLPVMQMGSVMCNKSSYFRNKFNIPQNKLIVLYSGNFCHWAKCLDIIETVKKWEEDFVLVLHTWNKASLKSEYFKKMQENAKQLPVYFSSEYLEYEDLPMALSSADIGLAFYEDLDDNFTEILFSSNKIGDYLKAGLPIVCSDFSSLKKFFEKHKIGKAISISNLPLALKEISNNLELYRKNVLTCYEDYFRFEKYFDEFYDELKI